MSDGVEAAPGDVSGGEVEIGEGLPGTLGRATLGNMGVASNGREARISLGWAVGALDWSTNFAVRAGYRVPTPGAVFEVASIAAGNLPEARVVFRAAADAGAPGADPHAMLLVAGDGSHGGGLRLGDKTRRVTVVATRWEPGEARPTAVDVEWWPGSDVRELVEDSAVRRARLAVGGTVELAGATLTVAAIEGASDRHPAWVVLRAP